MRKPLALNAQCVPQAERPTAAEDAPRRNKQVRATSPRADPSPNISRWFAPIRAYVVTPRAGICRSYPRPWLLQFECTTSVDRDVALTAAADYAARAGELGDRMKHGR